MHAYGLHGDASGNQSPSILPYSTRCKNPWHDVVGAERLSRVLPERRLLNNQQRQGLPRQRQGDHNDQLQLVLRLRRYSCRTRSSRVINTKSLFKAIFRRVARFWDSHSRRRDLRHSPMATPADGPQSLAIASPSIDTEPDPQSLQEHTDFSTYIQCPKVNRLSRYTSIGYGSRPEGDPMIAALLKESNLDKIISFSSLCLSTLSTRNWRP